MMSEYSVYTNESELKERDNILDLRISAANLDRQCLVSLLGGRELPPSQLQSFLCVDFYNHDSKTTDLCESYEPIYNTLFSFKNCVDDFYLKHLEKDSVSVDICLLQPKN